MSSLLHILKKIIPRPLFRFFQPAYHYSLALVGAVVYSFPSRNIKVIAITGTKGKSSTVEILHSILATAGYKVASASTIRFNINGEIRANLYKMTMPGRFFLQSFLRQAVDRGCEYAVIEMTSEGARVFRHAFIDLDALIFLNLAPEHIESHGSYEKYVQAKLRLATALAHSPKKRKVLVANADDKEASRFLAVPIKEKYPFTLTEATPWKSEESITLTFRGTTIHSPLRGKFNVYNILAAATFALTQNIPIEKIKVGIEEVREILGRVQYITLPPPHSPNIDSVSSSYAPQNFLVVVDYAHTPDSLRALYEAFGSMKKIAVLGNTGGGRDTWKRTEMANIAAEFCDQIILTNEDPYDDDPQSILDQMAADLEKRPGIEKKHRIILDRRQAIATALKEAVKISAVVLITGKGTDPYIMGPNNTKTPWSDAAVAREELARILSLPSGL